MKRFIWVAYRGSHFLGDIFADTRQEAEAIAYEAWGIGVSVLRAAT